MIKKTVTFKDFNGLERTETYHFHMNQAECMEFLAEHKTSGGDFSTMVTTLKDIILKSYGEIALDGKRFVKSEEATLAFYQTEAYSKIFMELGNDDEAANKFIEGVIPADLINQINMKQPVLR